MTEANQSKHQVRRNRIRWRMVPRILIGGLGAALMTGFVRNLAVGMPFMHPNHFLIFVSAVSWLFGAVQWFRGKWRQASALTIIGFVLPYFRPIF